MPLVAFLPINNRVGLGHFALEALGETCILFPTPRFGRIELEVLVKRSVLFFLLLCGCGGAETTTVPGDNLLPVPTGTAVYTGSLAQTITTPSATYTEVQKFAGSITLNANFNTGQLSASVSNPSSDFERSSTQSSAPSDNFVEEARYSGTVSGTGSVSGASFTGTLAGNLTQTSNDRSPVSGTPEAFAGTVAGQVSGTNYSVATGTLNLGRPMSGQTLPFFTDLGFSAARSN